MIESRHSTDNGATWEEWRQTPCDPRYPIGALFEQPDMALIVTAWEDGNRIEYRRPAMMG